MVSRASPHLPEGLCFIQPSTGVGTFRLDVQEQGLPRLLRAGPSTSLDEYSGLLIVDKFCQFTMCRKRVSIKAMILAQPSAILSRKAIAVSERISMTWSAISILVDPNPQLALSKLIWSKEAGKSISRWAAR
jgi:hypothetical protein